MTLKHGDLGSFNVTVTKETKKVKSIEVKSNTPKRKSYIEGETLDISGLKQKYIILMVDTETIDNGFNTNPKHGDTLNKIIIKKLMFRTKAKKRPTV